MEREQGYIAWGRWGAQGGLVCFGDLMRGWEQCPGIGNKEWDVVSVDD